MCLPCSYEHQASAVARWPQLARASEAASQPLVYWLLLRLDRLACSRRFLLDSTLQC